MEAHAPLRHGRKGLCGIAFAKREIFCRKRRNRQQSGKSMHRLSRTANTFLFIGFGSLLNIFLFLMFCLSSSNMQEAEVVSSGIIPLSGQNLHSVPPMHTLWANRLAAASILLIFASKIKPFLVFVGSCPAKNFPAPTAPPFSPVQRLSGRHTARLLGFLFLSFVPSLKIRRNRENALTFPAI